MDKGFTYHPAAALAALLAVALFFAAPARAEITPNPNGILVTDAELLDLAMSGDAWTHLLANANETSGTNCAGQTSLDLWDISADDDVCTLAKALAGRRLLLANASDPNGLGFEDDVETRIAAVTDELEALAGTESLEALNRNLGAYVLAADTMRLTGTLKSEFQAALVDAMDTELSDTRGGNVTLRAMALKDTTNWGSSARASALAAFLYIGGETGVAGAGEIYEAHLRWLGETATYQGFTDEWTSTTDWFGTSDPNAMFGVNPTGRTQGGCNVEDVMPEEIRRATGCGNVPATCADIENCDDAQYLWTGMQGPVITSMLIGRNGDTSVWSYGSLALSRASERHYEIQTWSSPNDDYWLGWTLKKAYSSSTLPRYQNSGSDEQGMGFGWSAWLHSDDMDCTFQTDYDSDGVCDSTDDCKVLYNPAQQDECEEDADDDGVDDVDDNCVFVPNPKISPASYQTVTGCQLDDDADGFGNECDADYNDAGSAVDSSDLALFKVAFGEKRSASSCNPGGTSPCDEYDHNNIVATIDGADFTIFKSLWGKTKKADGDIMEKCGDCTPPDDSCCSGDACPSGSTGCSCP